MLTIFVKEVKHSQKHFIWNIVGDTTKMTHFLQFLGLAYGLVLFFERVCWSAARSSKAVKSVRAFSCTTNTLLLHYSRTTIYLPLLSKLQSWLVLCSLYRWEMAFDSVT